MTPTGGLIAGCAQDSKPLRRMRTPRARHDQYVGGAGDKYIEDVAEDEQLGADVARSGAAAYYMKRVSLHRISTMEHSTTKCSCRAQGGLRGVGTRGTRLGRTRDPAEHAPEDRLMDRAEDVPVGQADISGEREGDEEKSHGNVLPHTQ